MQSHEYDYVLSIEKNLDHAHDIIDSVLSALRLFKEGRVISEYTLFLDEEKHQENPSLIWFKSPIISRGHGYAYVLHNNEVSNFIDFWKEYSDISIESYERVMERFNNSYNFSLKLEDKLLDYMISFEALYLKRREYEKRHVSVTPKGKVIALASSYFIGEDTNEREIIHDALNKAYKKRNDIVHNNEKIGNNIIIAKKEISCVDFILLIEEYLRRSIKKHLDLPITNVIGRWSIKNLELQYLASQGKLKILGYYGGDCPFCGTHIGTNVFETPDGYNRSWCGKCLREIYETLDQREIEWGRK